MFCPQCGSAQGDELKFCKACGANLGAVRQAVSAPEGVEKVEWFRMTPAERVVSWAEAQRHKDEIDLRRGLTPEVKRYNEIKAGVITSSIGLALMIFLFNFMEGIVAGGKVSHDTAQILLRVWFAGVIPLFVGLALIVNGLFVSKRIVEAAKRQEKQAETNALNAGAPPAGLNAADTSEFVTPAFSVTDQTTKHLSEHRR